MGLSREGLLYGLGNFFDFERLDGNHRLFFVWFLLLLVLCLRIFFCLLGGFLELPLDQSFCTDSLSLIGDFLGFVSFRFFFLRDILFFWRLRFIRVFVWVGCTRFFFGAFLGITHTVFASYSLFFTIFSKSRYCFLLGWRREIEWLLERLLCLDRFRSFVVIDNTLCLLFFHSFSLWALPTFTSVLFFSTHLF